MPSIEIVTTSKTVTETTDTIYMVQRSDSLWVRSNARVTNPVIDGGSSVIDNNAVVDGATLINGARQHLLGQANNQRRGGTTIVRVR